LTLVLEIRPDNPQLLFALARVEALAGNRRAAIEALRKAVEKGFENLEEIKTHTDFETIRGEKPYKQLIESFSRKSANPTGGHNAGNNE